MKRHLNKTVRFLDGPESAEELADEPQQDNTVPATEAVEEEVTEDAV